MHKDLPRIILLCGLKNSGKSLLSDELSDAFDGIGIKNKQLAFADPIKELAQMVFGWDSYYLWGESQLRSVFPIHWERYPAIMWQNARENCNAKQVLEFLKELGINSIDLVKGVTHLFERCVKITATPEYPYVEYSYKEVLTARLILETLGENVGRQNRPKVWTDAMERRLRANSDSICIISDGRHPDELDLVERLGGVCLYVKGKEAPVGTHISESYAEVNSNRCSFQIDNSARDLKILRQYVHDWVWLYLTSPSW